MTATATQTPAAPAGNTEMTAAQALSLLPEALEVTTQWWSSRLWERFRWTGSFETQRRELLDTLQIRYLPNRRFKRVVTDADREAARVEQLAYQAKQQRKQLAMLERQQPRNVGTPESSSWRQEVEERRAADARLGEAFEALSRQHEELQGRFADFDMRITAWARKVDARLAALEAKP